MNKESLKEKKQRLRLEGDGLKVIDKNLHDNYKLRSAITWFIWLIVYFVLSYMIGFVSGALKVLN